MTVRKTGNRAFAALNRILSLPGTLALGKIDIEVAQPTYGLQHVVQSSLAVDWSMIRFVDDQASGTSAYNLRPWVPGDWTTIARDGQLQSSPDAIPEDHDLWIWEWGLRVDAGGAAFVSAQTYRLNNFGSTAGGIQLLFWQADQLVKGIGSYSGGPVLQRPLPWYYPAAMRSANENHLMAVESTGTIDLVIGARVLSAPPGVFSPLG